jgi:hypothetical protein
MAEPENPLAIVGLPDAGAQAHWRIVLAGASSCTDHEQFHSIGAALISDYVFDWKKYRISPCDIDLTRPIRRITPLGAVP